MRRLDEDKNFFNAIIEKSISGKDSVVYKIAPHAGSGNVESFKVMPGVEVVYNNIYLQKTIKKNFDLKVNCVEITYCLKGQVEMEFKNKKNAYMSDGDLCIFGYQTEINWCDFSAKPFIGVTIVIYFPDIIDSLNSILDTNEFKEDNFLKEVFAADRCIIKYANQSIDHIFKELFIIPDKYKNHLIKLKVVELLIYLISDLDYKKSETKYFSKNSIEKIKDARRIILKNIDKHITIQEISKMVDMNTTDLEKGFKSIYGSTIFAYGKEFKMKKAKELLINEKMSVLDIALACGYSSGGKFSKAFKEAFGSTPTQYRKALK